MLLTLVALTLSTLRSNQKATLLGPAARAAKTLLNESLYQVEFDRPAGTRYAFWSTNGVWRDSSLSSGGVDYQYVIYANTVVDSSGAPLGANLGNRVKKVDLVLWWYNTRPRQGTREGMGRLELQASRLVNETPPPTP